MPITMSVKVSCDICHFGYDISEADYKNRHGGSTKGLSLTGIKYEFGNQWLDEKDRWSFRRFHGKDVVLCPKCKKEV